MENSILYKKYLILEQCTQDFSNGNAKLQLLFAVWLRKLLFLYVNVKIR